MKAYPLLFRRRTDYKHLWRLDFRHPHNGKTWVYGQISQYDDLKWRRPMSTGDARSHDLSHCTARNAALFVLVLADRGVR